jgi:hypothetical protein
MWNRLLDVLARQHGTDLFDDELDTSVKPAGPIDAIHDDAWFATAPAHLEALLGLLRPGGLLTLPNWFPLIDGLTGQPRNDWERWAGRRGLAMRSHTPSCCRRHDFAVSWVIRPPLGVAAKLPTDVRSERLK